MHNTGLIILGAEIGAIFTVVVYIVVEQIRQFRERIAADRSDAMAWHKYGLPAYQTLNAQQIEEGTYPR